MSKKSVRGFVLILVIFIMMVFGILGWTLAVMQAGNIGSSARNLQDKQALYLAESGAHWGLSDRIARGVTTSADNICSGADWVNHTLGPGQYSVCTRLPLAAETADVVVESIGYVPTIAAYASQRRITILASLGGFTKTVMAKGLFDWTDAPGTYIKGNMLAGNYSGDGDYIFNEPSDVASGVKNPKPDGNKYALRDIGSGMYPEINMPAYENDINAIKLAVGRTSIITGIVSDVSTTTITIAEANFFPSLEGSWSSTALRNISAGAWKTGSWANINSRIDGRTAVVNGNVDWQINDRITIVPRIMASPNPVFNAAQHTCTFAFNAKLPVDLGNVIRDFSRGAWEYAAWGVVTNVVPAAASTSVTITMDSSVTNTIWQANPWRQNDLIGIVRRFTETDADHGLLDNNNNNVARLLYIESDVLFDVRGNNNSIAVDRTGLVVEGDVVIRGSSGISMTARPWQYPNLVTKNGNIYSPDRPAGNNDNQIFGNRNFDDIIYSQNGDVLLNFVDAKAVYGNNVTFVDDANVRFDSALDRIVGYAFGTSGIEWKEQ